MKNVFIFTCLFALLCAAGCKTTQKAAKESASDVGGTTASSGIGAAGGAIVPRVPTPTPSPVTVPHPLPPPETLIPPEPEPPEPNDIADGRTGENESAVAPISPQPEKTPAPTTPPPSIQTPTTQPPTAQRVPTAPKSAENKNAEQTSSTASKNTADAESTESPLVSGVPLPILPDEESFDAESVIPSRSATIFVGQFFDVYYPGTGWLFMGSSDGSILSYSKRDITADGTTFVFYALAEGTTILRFFKQDVLTNTAINDYLEVICLARVGDISGRVPSTVPAPAFSKNSSPVSSPIDQMAELPMEPAMNHSMDHQQLTSETITTEPSALPSVAPADQIPESPALADTASEEPQMPEIIDEGSLLSRAETAFSEGHHAQAAEFIERFFERTPAVNVDKALYLKGQVYEAQSSERNIKTALESYQALADNFPFSPLWQAAQNRITYLRRFYFDIR